MKKISKTINKKFLDVIYICFMVIMVFALPREDLDPHKSKTALILIPVFLICLILMFEKFKRFSKIEIKLIRRYTRTIIYSVKLKNSKLAFKLITLSYALTLVQGYIIQLHFYSLVIALILFVIALVLIIEENTRLWLKNYQTTINISIAITSAISIFSTSIISNIEINDVFGIDPSIFNNTLYALISYNILKFILPPLSLFLFLFLYISNKFKINFIPNKRYIFFIAFVMMLEGITMHSHNKTKNFIIQTALISDFNNRNLCQNSDIHSDTPLVYLDRNMHKVLTAIQNEKETTFAIKVCM